MSSYRSILERLNSHKRKIQKSFMFYRPIAKKQKINVLIAATKYLASDINKQQFIKIISMNKAYANSFFKSKTKRLIECALNENPRSDLTKEGYIRIKNKK